MYAQYIAIGFVFIVGLVCFVTGMLAGSKQKVNPWTLFCEKGKNDGRLSITRVVIITILVWFLYEADKIINATMDTIKAGGNIVVPDFPEGLVWLICVIYGVNKGAPVFENIAEKMGRKHGG